MKTIRSFLVALVLGMVLSAGAGQARAEASAERAASRPAASGPTTRPAESRQAEGAGETPAKARQLYWRGEYDAAIAAYERLAKDPLTAVAAGIGLAEAQAMVGRYEDALASLRAVEARAKLDAEWHVALSGLLAVVGKYPESLAAARAGHELRDDWAPAILCLGQALETLGRKKQAIDVYQTLDKAISHPGFTTDARSLTAAGKVLDRFAILTGRKASEQAQNILHNYFQDAYQKADKTYWPANLAAGILLLEKHKPQQAKQEFDLALKANQNLPDAHIGHGVILLGMYRFEQAMALADKALKINPRHPDGLLLRAVTNMLWRKFDQVAPELEKLLKLNPSHLEALSLMAAVHVRKFQPEQAEPYIRRVQKVNPNYAQLYEVIADWLAAGRQFHLAEDYYKKAMSMAPELAGPVTGLGRLYMQTGQETLAEQTLEKAFALDDFRGDVLNYLKLLRAMKKFSVKETEHFIFKVDGQHDEVLLEWLAEVAETKIYPDVSRDFGYTPKEKTLVEMFPDHGQFSVRISGRGWIGTVGACTGRVIAMPAPDPLRGGFGQFNWYAVLRHEYTHTVTLTMTRNRIPHWFTEACAVWEQPDRRNFQAVGLLVDAVRTGKLYPMKELSWGFIRPDPRRRGARSLAYAQSEWIFEYIDAAKGRKAILDMLKGFDAGWTQEKVFREALGTTEAEFDKDFQGWAKEQVRGWGFDPEPPPEVKAAEAAAKKHPDSADAQADLALALLHRAARDPRRARRDRQRAEQVAREALKIEPRHPRALAVLGSLLVDQEKYDDAIETALILEQADPKSADAPKILARCYSSKRQWKNAIPALERYKKLLPLDPYGHEELAKIYMQLGLHEQALPNLAEMHRRTLKDPKYARQAADICRTANRPQQALEFYEQVLQINPYDSGAYKSMAALALRVKDYDQAERAMRSASLIEPKSAETWAQLAMVYYRVARAKKLPARLAQARQAAEKSVQLDPEGQGKMVLALIEQAEEKK